MQFVVVVVVNELSIRHKGKTEESALNIDASMQHPLRFGQALEIFLLSLGLS